MLWVLIAACGLVTSVALLLQARSWRGRLRVTLQTGFTWSVGLCSLLLVLVTAKHYRLNRSDLLGLIGIAATIGVTLAASQLVRDLRTLTVGVVIPSMRPFHREVRRGIAEAVQGRPFRIVDPYNEGDYPEEDLTSFARCLSAAIRARADYLIICAPSVSLAESPDLQRACQHFASRGGHLVFIESVPNAELLDCLKSVTTLTSDSVAGASLIARFVADGVATGDIRKVLIVPGPSHSRPAVQRLDALKSALPSGCDVAVRTTLTWTSDEARETVERYLKQHGAVDAICCGNDDMAIGAAEAVAVLGVSVGCITGHDGLMRAVAAIADPFSPIAATVRIPPSSFGGQAVAALEALRLTWTLLVPRGFRRVKRNESSSQILPITGASLVTKHNAGLLLD